MILRYEERRQRSMRLPALTGLNHEEFERLLPSFEAAWEDHRKNDHRPLEERKRVLGAGRPGKLRCAKDKRLFILVSFTVSPLQEVQGMLFGLSQGQANEWIHRLTDVLHATLQRDLQLPARDAAPLEAVLAACESHRFVIDGTERPTQRSSHDEVQREHDSGKKMHTHKHVVVGDLASGKSAS